MEVSFDTTNFFDEFKFITFDDKTHGFVDYVDRPTAEEKKLVQYKDGKVYIGADYENEVPDNKRGRPAVRLESNYVLNGNQLVVLDLDHMPTTVGEKLPKGCSIWPAFWMTNDSYWPNKGEVDIIEYVNNNQKNAALTLHTIDTCSFSSTPPDSYSGVFKGRNSCEGLSLIHI